MTNYSVQIEGFEGPMDLLLQLIEKNELDITEVSLATVADQYIEYINAMEVSPEDIVDFLVVVSRLLYLKSKILLPSLILEDEEGIDLEKQLKMYKAFVEASKKLKKQLHKNHHLYVREKYPEHAVEGFLPPKGVSLNRLHDVFALILKRIEPIVELPKKMVKKAISIYDKIQHIHSLLSSGNTVNFSTVIANSIDKSEKIVSFLAMLELVKQRSIMLDQGELFGDIIINKNTDVS
jgi:segregation and condensation protein A